MTKRTDPHRKGAIIPAEYEHVLSYNQSTTLDGDTIPSYKINCEMDRRRWEIQSDGTAHCINGEHDADGRCCVVGLRQIAKVPFAVHGGTGKCAACGARFVYGDVWRHLPTGEHIHIGHICSRNYGLIHDRSAFELEAGRRAAAAAAQCRRERNAEERRAFLAEHPGLEADLDVDHYIVRDIKARFVKYCQISDKQIALVRKIADESRLPPKLREAHVAAPLGRQTYRGTVVPIKDYETPYGVSTKMTVKVTTPDGVWLSWGTVPAALYADIERGSQVEITATLEQGRDAHFAIAKRPKGRLLEQPAA